jgi:Protein of unknown function (DUF1634)
MTDADISRLEAILGRLLLGGVLSASGCLTAGLTLWLTRVAPPIANALLTAGLMILMATPILRVVVSLVEYTRMRDWFFATTTLVVLIVLAVTVAVAVYNVKPG